MAWRSSGSSFAIHGGTTTGGSAISSATGHQGVEVCAAINVCGDRTGTRRSTSAAAKHTYAAKLGPLTVSGKTKRNRTRGFVRTLYLIANRPTGNSTLANANFNGCTGNYLSALGEANATAAATTAGPTRITAGTAAATTSDDQHVCGIDTGRNAPTAFAGDVATWEGDSVSIAGGSVTGSRNSLYV